MIGGILGLCSAATFGLNSIITRRGVLRVSSRYVTAISIFTGPLFFFPIATLTGEIFEVGQIPWRAYLHMALSGVCHFALGRAWAYKSIQIIGSTRSNVVISLNTVVTILLAMAVLKETLTLPMVFGILFSLSGPILILLKEEGRGKAGFKELDRRTLCVGMLYGIGAAIFWGSSAIFIKLGLENGGTPIAGSLIAYLAASLAISPSSFFKEEKRQEILRQDRKSFELALLTGLTSSAAQLLRYLALGYSSVIVVSLMIRSMPLWVLIFAFIFNRQYESFSLWVLLGNGLLMIGTILVLIP
jgi:drug/metabolite transporter (DMT)-like permease